MSNTVEMRKQIKKAYGNSPIWVAKVNKMPDGQILALYQSLVKQGKVRNTF